MGTPDPGFFDSAKEDLFDSRFVGFLIYGRLYELLILSSCKTPRGGQTFIVDTMILQHGGWIAPIFGAGRCDFFSVKPGVNSPGDLVADAA